LIVIAAPTVVVETSERVALPNAWSVQKDGTKQEIIISGIETTFDILTVLKGENSKSTLVLHHFKLADSRPFLANGPQFVSFNPEENLRYLMFLQREPDGRYVSACGQTDPVYAINRLSR